MNSCKRKNTLVSASDLSQMGACERLVYFEAKYGKRPSRDRVAAARRGISEHEKFFEEGVRLNPMLGISAEKRWCFIASAVFGPMAPETQILRRFRDEILRKTIFGRAMVRVYYRVSPGICERLIGKRVAIAAVRIAMRLAVVLAEAVLKICSKRRRIEL